nr:monofunctional riboflavin biosynthesis protein RIBA 3, chloroplastic [Tanacetum cinerariifolium]
MDDSISNPKRRYRHASPNDYAAKYLTGIYGNDIRVMPTIYEIGNIGGSENGSVFDVFGTNAGEKDNSKAFKTVDAEITPETVDFFVSDTNGDPDCLTDGFSSVKDADRY